MRVWLPCGFDRQPNLASRHHSGCERKAPRDSSHRATGANLGDPERGGFGRELEG